MWPGRPCLHDDNAIILTDITFNRRLNQDVSDFEDNGGKSIYENIWISGEYQSVGSVNDNSLPVFEINIRQKAMKGNTNHK